MDIQTRPPPPPPRDEPSRDDPQLISTTDARAGSTGNKVRFVLLVSLVIAVIAMAFVYLGSPEIPLDAPNSTENREPG